MVLILRDRLPRGARHGGCREEGTLKRFLKWTAIIGGSAVGGTLLVRAVQRGRSRLKHAVGQAEDVAAHTRAALEQTEAALRHTREAL